MVRFFIQIAFAAILLLGGLFFVCFPEWMRKVGLRHINSSVFGKLEAIEDFFGTRQFIWEVRATGIIALIASCVLFWASVRGVTHIAPR
jgi:uncharacterized protein YjeT (DUF2065 family)